MLTAEELLQELSRDPEWVARDKLISENLRVRRAFFRAEERPIVEDLRHVGIIVDSLWDLVNTDDRYIEGIPVLLNHLDGKYDPKTLEGIVRALTVPEARGVAGPRILDKLENTGENSASLRWALANALTVVADRSMRERLKRLIAVESDIDVKKRLETAYRRATRTSSATTPATTSSR